MFEYSFLSFPPTHPHHPGPPCLAPLFPTPLVIEKGEGITGTIIKKYLILKYLFLFAHTEQALPGTVKKAEWGSLVGIKPWIHHTQTKWALPEENSSPAAMVDTAKGSWTYSPEGDVNILFWKKRAGPHVK